MAHLRAICLNFVTLIGLVHGADALAMVVEVPSATAVKVQVPQGWDESTAHATKELPVTRMKLYSDKDKTISMQITFLEDKAGTLTDQQRIDQFVANASGEQYREASVEKAVKVVPLKSKHLLGAYAQFTDAALAEAKDVAPPKYKKVTSATLVIGKTIAAVTILSNSVDSPAYKQAIQFLTDDIQKN